MVPNIAERTLKSYQNEVKLLNNSPSLVHVEVTLEDALLHGVRDLGLLGHLADGRLHNGHALRALMSRSLAVNRVCTRNGCAFGTVAEILCKVVSFTCF